MAEMRQDMFTELATHVARGRKSVQDSGRRAQQHIKRAAEIAAGMLTEYTHKAVARAVENAR